MRNRQISRSDFTLTLHETVQWVSIGPYRIVRMARRKSVDRGGMSALGVHNSPLSRFSDHLNLAYCENRFFYRYLILETCLTLNNC